MELKPSHRCLVIWMSTPTCRLHHWTVSSWESPTFSWFCSAQAVLPHSGPRRSGQTLPTLLKPGPGCKKNLGSAGDSMDNKSLLFLVYKKPESCQSHFVTSLKHLKGKIDLTNAPRPRLSGSQSLGCMDSPECPLEVLPFSWCPDLSCGPGDQEAFVASGPPFVARPASAGWPPGRWRLETAVRWEARTLSSGWKRLAPVAPHRLALGCF